MERLPFAEVFRVRGFDAVPATTQEWRIFLSFRRATPIGILACTMLTVQFVQLVLLILFEKVEFDTFTYYFSKVELMRFRDVDAGHIPVMSFVQEFMPVGYSKFQMLFCSGPYARNAGNFIIVVGIATYLLMFVRRLFLPLALLALTNVAFFTQYAGYKADAPLAALSVLLLHLITRSRFPLQVTASTIVVCFMASIKWTGGLVVIPALGIYLWRLQRGLTRISPLDLICAFATLAALIPWLDLGVYLDSYKSTGSFVPTETFGVAGLKVPNPLLLVNNVLSYFAVSFLETFEMIWRHQIHHPIVGRLIELFSLGGKTNVVMNSNQIMATLNIFDLMAVFASILTLRCRDSFVKACAIVALFYYAISLSVYPYQANSNRYFLPAQILAYVPLAYVARINVLKWLRRRTGESRARLSIAGAVGVAAVHLIISFGMFAFEKERNLLPVVETPLVSTKDIQNHTLPDLSLLGPIYSEVPVTRLFRGWQGYQFAYLAMQRNVALSDDIQIIFDSSANDANYLYPFLQGRSVANTRLSDIKGLADSQVRLTSTRVLCFGKRACSLRPNEYREESQATRYVSLWIN
jgi:hypothetical protein